MVSCIKIVLLFLFWMSTLKTWIKSLSSCKDKHYESNGERGLYPFRHCFCTSHYCNGSTHSDRSSCVKTNWKLTLVNLKWTVMLLVNVNPPKLCSVLFIWTHPASSMHYNPKRTLWSLWISHILSQKMLRCDAPLIIASDHLRIS